MIRKQDLKIKDDVDLSILEKKYGFKLDLFCINHDLDSYFNAKAGICVRTKSRKIIVYGNNEYDLTILYDWIVDGLVEKAE